MAFALSGESYNILPQRGIIYIYTQIFSLIFGKKILCFLLGFWKPEIHICPTLADQTFHVCNIFFKKIEAWNHTLFQKRNAHLNRKCKDLQTCLLWEFLCDAYRKERLQWLLCFFWDPGSKIIVQLRNMKHSWRCHQIPFYNITITFTDNLDAIS